MTDILWFFAIFFTYLGVYGLLHVAGLRRHRPVRLMLYLMGVYAVGAMVASVLCHWAFADRFSSPGAYSVANTGAVVAGFFASAFYILLGPATADRSLTAHLLIYLRQSNHQGQAEPDLLAAFSPGTFLQKRYRECRRAGLLERNQGEVRLSVMGGWVAAVYDLLLKGLALDRRGEFYFSFRGREP